MCESHNNLQTGMSCPPDKQEGTEEQGSYLVVQDHRVTSEVRQTCKAGLPGQEPGSKCCSSHDTPLPLLLAPCRGLPSSLPSAHLYISPTWFWSSFSCQTTCKAELVTLGCQERLALREAVWVCRLHTSPRLVLTCFKVCWFSC